MVLVRFSLLVLFLVAFVHSQLVELWSAEHLDDVTLQDAQGKNAPALVPMVLGLYETECKKTLYRSYGFTAKDLPSQLDLFVGVFDRQLAQSRPWYTWEESVMDLFARYQIDTSHHSKSQWCPTVIFQPANWSEPIDFYTPQQGPFVDWVWSHLQVDVSFTNTLDESVGVLFSHPDSIHPQIINQPLLATIAPGETAMVSSLHASDVIVVLNAESMVVNRYRINTITKHIDITQTDDEKYLNDDQYRNMIEVEHQLLLRRQWSTRRRYLNIIRTPPLLPAFTEIGYRKAHLPQDVCDMMVQFWEDSRSQLRQESFPVDGTQINVREVQTYMAHLSGSQKAWIAEQLKPVLEEWSGVPLRYSTMYGLREYRHGAVLKNHVDRVETHVISTIIHVAHDGEDEWPLELVGWDGKRVLVQDDVCDMVFYESSKLIHGRPQIYNGTSWVNAFLHFRPIDWNGYEFTPNNVIKTPYASAPLVDFIYG